jgi:hypothetical protein
MVGDVDWGNPLIRPTERSLAILPAETYSSKLVRVRVTLRLTVSQPVSLGVEPLLGPMTRFLVLHGDYYGLYSLGAPSLTRGWICHLSEVFVMFYVRIFTLLYRLHYTI